MEKESKLRQFRLSEGLSEQEFGDLVGLDGSTISLVERGKRNLSFRMKVRVARALRVRISTLFDPPSGEDVDEAA